MAFQRWQQQLHELLEAVHRKQRQYDKASSACQVLLKPWPKKSKESESTAKKDVPDSSNNAADEQISPHEEAELKLVEDLLKRAQKTRVKPASKKLKEDGCLVDNSSLPSRSEKELWQICDSEPQTPQGPAPKVDTQPSKSKPVSVIKTSDKLQKNVGTTRTEPLTKNGVRKQQQQVHSARENGDGSVRSASRETSSRSISRHVVGSNVPKPASSVDQKRSKSFGSLESSRPSSRPRSGHGNVKPAHATAPFKTDPTLHVPRRSAKSSIRPVKQPSNKRQNYTRDKNYTNRILPPIVSEKDSSPSLSPSVPEEKDIAILDVLDTPSGWTDGELQPKMECERQSSSDEVLDRKLSGLTLGLDSAPAAACESLDVSGKVPHPDAASSEGAGEQDVKLFSLLSNGSSIHIPPKVRRAFAKNQQLRKKVSQRLHTQKKPKQEGTDPGQIFADKLQQFFDPEEELVYRQQTLECLHAHQQLLQLLLQLDLDHLTEASSAKEVLRSKMLAEFVLSSFSAFSDEINMLTKVQFPDRPAVQQPHHKEMGHLYLWLPASFQDLRFEDKLQYTSKTNLNGYMNMLLQLQALQCQHSSMNILVNDVLPWLQKQDCNHEDLGAVLRGLFALLTSNGSQLPVLIQDVTQ